MINSFDFVDSYASLIEGIDPKIKNELKKSTDDACQMEIFGAPSFVINNKIFCGQYHLEFTMNEGKK